MRIRSIETIPVLLPMHWALGTSADIVREAPIVLVNLMTDVGVGGQTYLFCYAKSAMPAISAVMKEISDVLHDDEVEPGVIAGKLQKRYTLLGVRGVVRMALSAVDVACWDALAREADKPLARLLGGRPSSLRAYNSNGLGLIGAEAAADEAEQLLESAGLRSVKLRLGYDTMKEDIDVTRVVRRRLPDDVNIMVDVNQAWDVSEAITRGKALEREGIYWYEEAIRHDNYAGYRKIAEELQVPVQIGENFSGPEALLEALRADACDYVMPDVMRIGGVTGWMAAAGMASAAGISMSSHLHPELSAQLLSVTPTQHWLEYVDWMNSIVKSPLVIKNGVVETSSEPGCGLDWDMEQVKKYRVDVY